MSVIDSDRVGGAKQLLADDVFHRIGQRIVDGVLEAGDRIRDVAVAEELRVSRTPVREALQRLERLGLVAMHPSRFTEVTHVTPEIVDQTREFAGYQAGISARMGVPWLEPDERITAGLLVEDMFASLDAPRRTADTRAAVFGFLSARSRNARHIAVVRESAVAVSRNLRDWHVPDSDRARMRQVYVDFREAVLRGDGDDAERHARTMHYV
jgi:DNA-binding GntR family transcriptional regulator